MSSRYPYPTTTPLITVDPSAPGNAIRIALFVESIFNFTFSTYTFLAPHHALSMLSSSPTLITTLTITLLQFMGVIGYAMTLLMVLAIPNTRRGIELRVPTYLFLGTAEVLLITLFAYLGLVEGVETTGIEGKTWVNLTANLVPPLLWRVSVLYLKPEWLGRYTDVAKKE